MATTTPVWLGTRDVLICKKADAPGLP